MNEEFDKWFDQAVTKGIFKLTAPSAQYHAAKASWKAEKEVSVLSGGKGFTITGPSVKLEQTSAKVKDSPTQRHLTGYLRGRVRDGWETFIVRETYFARYNKYLTEDEINQAIIGFDDQAIIADKWKDNHREGDSDHNGIFYIPDPDK